MDWFYAWWASVPDWAKPVLLAFVLPTSLAIFIWIFAKGLPAMRRQFNIWILESLERTEALIRSREHVDESRPEALAEKIQEESRIPTWLIKRAKLWLKRRNKYGI